jgi:hypothetical protein
MPIAANTADKIVMINAMKTSVIASSMIYRNNSLRRRPVEEYIAPSAIRTRRQL